MLFDLPWSRRKWHVYMVPQVLSAEPLQLSILTSCTGTGKTHTLIEIIRQLTASDLNDLAPSRKILVCGASNLSVDNILERLLSLPRPAVNKDAAMKVTRVGHPARVMALQDVLDATLDARASRTEQAALAKDVKDELEALMKTLSGKGKGGGKNKPPKGLARKKLWEEVKALRKECVFPRLEVQAEDLSRIGVQIQTERRWSCTVCII